MNESGKGAGVEPAPPRMVSRAALLRAFWPVARRRDWCEEAPAVLRKDLGLDVSGEASWAWRDGALEAVVRDNPGEIEAEAVLALAAREFRYASTDCDWVHWDAVADILRGVGLEPPEGTPARPVADIPRGAGLEPPEGTS